VTHFIEPLSTYEDLNDLALAVTSMRQRMGAGPPGTRDLGSSFGGARSTRMDICQAFDVHTSRVPAGVGLDDTSRPGKKIPFMLEVAIDVPAMNETLLYVGVPRARYPSPTYRMRNTQGITPVNPAFVGKEFSFYDGTAIDFQWEMYRDNPLPAVPERCFAISPNALNALVYLMRKVGGGVWCEFADVLAYDEYATETRKQAAKLHQAPRSGRDTQTFASSKTRPFDGPPSDDLDGWFTITKNKPMLDRGSALPGGRQRSPTGWYFPLLNVGRVYE